MISVAMYHQNHHKIVIIIIVMTAGPRLDRRVVTSPGEKGKRGEGKISKNVTYTDTRSIITYIYVIIRTLARYWGLSVGS